MSHLLFLCSLQYSLNVPLLRLLGVLPVHKVSSLYTHSDIVNNHACSGANKMDKRLCLIAVKLPGRY